MSVVVTGVAGFIGSHLAARLLEQGESVLGLDCLTDYYDVTLKVGNVTRLQAEAQFRFEQIDLAAADLTPLLTGATRIFHLAAQPGVRGSWGDGFADYVRQNIVATQRLLESLRGTAARIVVASSSSVYGDAAAFPTTEDAVPQPSSPYGVSKLATEQLAMAYHRSYGLDVRAVRYFTVYGPRQRPDMAFSRFISAARRHESVDIYGDGLQIRDFTYVADAVDATIRAGSVEMADGGIFNVGGGSQTTVLDVLTIIGDALSEPVRVRHLPDQPGDVRRTGADLTKARAVLGWHPAVPIEVGLRRQVAASLGE
jgi:UDP-glucuronate 4-epimerase